MPSQEDKQTIWDDSAIRYQTAEHKLYWETVDLIRQYQNRRASGDENKDFLQYTIEQCRPLAAGGRKLRALSIGCTESEHPPEESLLESGLFESVDVMDIAGGLLEKQEARMRAKGLGQGLKYMKCDLNETALEPEQYDLIFGVGTVHHLEDLEGFFGRVNRALRPEGLFMLREFIGPNRLNFTPEQTLMVNKALALVPEKYRRMPDGRTKADLQRDWMYIYSVDPSESIRSEDLLVVLARYLDLRKLSYTGGALLHPLMGEIAGNFEADEEGLTVLRLLILLEETLLDMGAIKSDYVFCLAGKRVAPEPAYPVASDTKLDSKDLRIMDLMTRARQLDGIVVRLTGQQQPLRKEIAAQYAELERLRALEAELLSMRATKGWRALEALRKIKRWLRG